MLDIQESYLQNNISRRGHDSQTVNGRHRDWNGMLSNSEHSETTEMLFQAACPRCPLLKATSLATRSLFCGTVYLNEL